MAPPPKEKRLRAAALQATGTLAQKWRSLIANGFEGSGKGAYGNDYFGGLGCRRSRRFSFATETTVGRGSTRVGAFKRRFEPQESNIRKSSSDTAVRFRSCARGSRDQLFAATGTKKLPTLKLPDGTIIGHSWAILAWVRDQPERGDTLKRVA
jgi:hypothetical protein